MLNKVILQGRLTENPMLKFTKTEKAFTTFSVAVEDNRKTGDERNVNFFRIQAWGASAEFICKYFEKGQQIIVDGRLATSSYTDKNDIKRKDIYIVAEGINFCGAKSAQAQEKDIEETFENCEPDNLPFD